MEKCPTKALKDSDFGQTKDYKILWKQEVERRTTLMKLAQKATRDYDELKHRFTEATHTIDSLTNQLQENEHQLNQLQNASEAVYHEYQTLKKTYEIESETMAQAFSRASEWYKENQSLKRETATLKRQSVVLLQMTNSVSDSVKTAKEIADFVDFNENHQQHEQEINNLMSKIRKLEAEVATANAELNKVRQDEFEAQEEALEVRKLLELEQETVKELTKKVEELEGTDKRLEQISMLVVKEVEKLQAKLFSESTRAENALSQAAKARREHVALVRQSAVVLSEAASDCRVRRALDEVRRLSNQVLEEQERHKATVKELQDKIASYETQETEEELMMLREKICLLEEEVISWRRKALQEQSEAKSLRALELELQGNKREISPEIPPTTNWQQTTESVPPPPPPPPPPPNTQLQPPNNSSAVTMLAAMIGVPKRRASCDLPADKGNGMDNLIDQIKRGGIQLKQTTNFLRKSSLDETPEAGTAAANAVQEMKSILATMKKSRSGRVKPSAVSQETKGRASIPQGMPNNNDVTAEERKNAVKRSRSHNEKKSKTASINKVVANSSVDELPEGGSHQ